MARRRAPEDVRREEILRAAYEVAAREGLGSLTVRAVAAEANLSHALVLFHFGRKERVMQELLERLLATTSVLHVSEEVARVPRAVDRLHALLRQEITRLSREPRQTRLLLEYWALGVLQEPIRVRVRAEAKRYRHAFQSLIAELVEAEPAAFAGTTAPGLAAAAVAWVQGCAVQAMIDPEHFDVDGMLGAVWGVVRRVA